LPLTPKTQYKAFQRNQSTLGVHITEF